MLIFQVLASMLLKTLLLLKDEQYWRDRIFGETGVEIRDEDEIYELLCQTVAELYDTVSDRYHYDPCFEVSDMETPVKDGTTKVFTVTSNAFAILLPRLLKPIILRANTVRRIRVKHIHNRWKL